MAQALILGAGRPAKVKISGMGQATRYVLALAAWMFAGFLILPLGQATLIAAADGHSVVAMLVGAAFILMWMAGA